MKTRYVALVILMAGFAFLGPVAVFADSSDTTSVLTRYDLGKMLYRIDGDLLMGDAVLRAYKPGISKYLDKSLDAFSRALISLRAARAEMFRLRSELGEQGIVPDNRLALGKYQEYSDTLTLYEGLLLSVYLDLLDGKPAGTPVDPAPQT